MNSAADATDLRWLAEAIELSAAAAAAGELPFGAIIVGVDGRTLARAKSTEISTGDWTCHAEMNAVRAACVSHPRSILAGATIYASAEPCIMCASAIFYAGVRRVVYALGEARLRALLALRQETAGLNHGCREVFDRAADATEVHGPLLEAEAARVQETYWSAT